MNKQLIAQWLEYKKHIKEMNDASLKEYKAAMSAYVKERQKVDERFLVRFGDPLSSILTQLSMPLPPRLADHGNVEASFEGFMDWLAEKENK